MTEQNQTRPGRYPGPSLQADAEAWLKKGRYEGVGTTCQRAVTRPKQTRAEIAQAKNDAAIADLRAAGGIVAYGAWSTGSGNYGKRRDVPDGAVVWQAYDVEYPHLKCPANVRAWFAAHPRAQRCVAIKE